MVGLGASLKTSRHEKKRWEGGDSHRETRRVAPLCAATARELLQRTTTQRNHVGVEPGVLEVQADIWSGKVPGLKVEPRLPSVCFSKLPGMLHLSEGRGEAGEKGDPTDCVFAGSLISLLTSAT